MKVADIRLGWKRSVSVDLLKQVLHLTVDGTTTTAELGPEVQEYAITVQAQKSVQFQVESIDTEERVTMSMLYDFTLGDLEDPQPATDLFHEIIGIRDEDVA